MNPDPTITYVCGFGRCGTSLVMQMLEAGGMPVTGPWPSFEDEHTLKVMDGGEISADWLASKAGHAVKVLDPHRGTIPRGPCRAIWLDRDPDEQAKSQAKFLETTIHISIGREERRRLAKSYRDDRPAAFKVLRAAGARQILELRFEELLSAPASVATRIATHCSPELNIARMAAAVRRTSPECAPDMAMELALMAERDTA